TAEASAVPVVRAPVIELSCVAPLQAPVKRPLEVVLTVRNTGTDIEPKVRVVVTLPAKVRATGASTGGSVADNCVVWELEQLAPGTARDLSVSVVAGDPGQITIAARAQGECAPPVETSCTARFVGVGGVLLEVVDLEDPVLVGENVTYEIKVVNQGSAPLNNVKLTCTVPEQQEFVAGFGATPVRIADRRLAMDTVTSLAPGATVSWRVTVKAIAQGDVRFRTELVSDEFTAPIHEIEAPQQY
ncbi:MAG: hypothetical protein N3G20_08195, partial [Verrucomicrobiae bacterium]|nr:hypothetical protein [Verrucomicrobiae bacterium]